MIHRCTIETKLSFRQTYILSALFNIISHFFSCNSKNAAIADPENMSPRCGSPAARSTPSLMSPFHPFRSTPTPLFLVGWLGKRDATHLLPNYFAHGPVKNFPRCHYCSVARENLVICSFHCFSSPAGPENTLLLSFLRGRGMDNNDR